MIIDEQVSKDKKRKMVKLCHIDEIEESGAKGFELDTHNVFVVKRDGMPYVYLNNCPHLGIPLEYSPDKFMDSENYFIQCSTHGALFEVESGHCVSGPCSGQALRQVPHRIQDGDIFISLKS